MLQPRSGTVFYIKGQRSVSTNLPFCDESIIVGAALDVRAATQNQFCCFIKF